MAVSTANIAATFGSLTVIEVANGHDVPVDGKSLEAIMKPAEAALPGGSTIVGTPAGQNPLPWPSVMCSTAFPLPRNVTAG